MHSKQEGSIQNPWHLIDYTPDVPPHFLIPEHHWPEFSIDGLSSSQRVALNHLACLFTCEMFVYLERYIISYIERNYDRLSRDIKPVALDRFLREEYDHVDAFYKLLKLLAPDQYPSQELRMIRRSFTDRLILRTVNIPAFFFTASLFEEMTLYVADVMDEDMSQSFAPLYDVMRLHAKEEKSHVGIDNHLLRCAAKRLPTPLFTAQLSLSMPIIGYYDRTLTKAWRRQAQRLGRELGLNQSQIMGISRRGISTSDRKGLSSFCKKQRKLNLPGAGMLCSILERATGQPRSHIPHLKRDQ